MSQNRYASASLLPPENLEGAFRRAFRHHPAGVAILTADGQGGPIALTVSSLISINASPPLVAFSLSAASNSAAELLRAETLVIHFLSRKDKKLASLCATAGSDRFGGQAAWERLPTGEPRYSNVETWFRASLGHRLPVAGATLVTAEILGGDVAKERTFDDALVYLDRQWHGLAADDEWLVPHMEAPAMGAWRFWA